MRPSTALSDFDVELLDAYERTVYNDLREQMTKENVLQNKNKN